MATTPTDTTALGQKMYQLITELYPICRSITGDGLRQSLQMLQRHIPLELHEVPTGTLVFDWTVPNEWNIREAYIKNEMGEKVVDFANSSLHVLNYSTPIRRTMSLAELRPHLFTIPEHPDWIPYRTSYYRETWGFCLSHNTLESLPEGQYEVYIDSSLAPGHLTYGELYLPGQSSDEILISSHSCHPSLANDNLSGMVVNMMLAEQLSQRQNRYSYRFLFIPGTIGAITWLAHNEAATAHIKHGLVLACLGDEGHLHYKRSRQGQAEIDRAVAHVLAQRDESYEICDFSPYGYDERQFCSPGFNLAVGNLSRTPHGQFPEYHTSADNLDFVKPAALVDSFETVLSILEVLEGNGTYLNLNPKCEPQLGKRGLYGAFGGRIDTKVREMTMLWVLNLADGEHSLLDMAERSGTPFALIRDVAQVLEAYQLLRRLE